MWSTMLRNPLSAHGMCQALVPFFAQTARLHGNTFLPLLQTMSSSFECMCDAQSFQENPKRPLSYSTSPQHCSHRSNVWILAPRGLSSLSARHEDYVQPPCTYTALVWWTTPHVCVCVWVCVWVGGWVGGWTTVRGTRAHESPGSDVLVGSTKGPADTAWAHGQTQSGTLVHRPAPAQTATPALAPGGAPQGHARMGRAQETTTPPDPPGRRGIPIVERSLALALQLGAQGRELGGDGGAVLRYAEQRLIEMVTTARARARACPRMRPALRHPRPHRQLHTTVVGITSEGEPQQCRRWRPLK